MGDLFVHFGKIEKGSISNGQNVNLEIDVIKRNNSKAYHSATHLLHESLRRTLGKHVTQKGSLVSPDRLRFDFSHNKPIEKDEMVKINKIVNEIIDGSSDVQTRIMTPKEAVSMGALALFGEKYGDEVRVVFMGKEKNGFFSTELCGGTHVKNTKEVGKFKVISQSSIASGVRRVEALRDKQLALYEKAQREDRSLKEINLKEEIEIIEKDLKKLKINPNYKNNLDLDENLKNLKKQLNIAKIENIKKDKNKNIIKDKKIGKILIREQILKDFPPKELRSIIDQGKKDIKSGIIISISTFEDKVGVAVGVSQDLTSNYDAVHLVKIASEILGGKGGGGRKDFAQAGGLDKNKIEIVFKEISKKIS
jgi:alanyl-tRNA synthetase